MPMPWFRFYSEALDDPKVQRLTGDLFKVWVNLLCLASEQDERGTLPYLDDIAFRLRLDPQKADDALLGLKRAGLIDVNPTTGDYMIHAWIKRQPPSDEDSTAAERKRRERQRKQGDKPVTRDVTRDSSVTSRIGHGRVTGDVTRLDKKRLEEDTDQRETENVLRPVPPSVAKGGGAAAPRQTPTAPTVLHPAPKPKDAPPVDRPRDLLFEAVCDACLIDWHQLTDTERGRVNHATAQIRKAGGTPEAVALRSANYRGMFSTPLTPNALAGNWATSAHAQQPSARAPNGTGRGELMPKDRDRIDVGQRVIARRRDGRDGVGGTPDEAGGALSHGADRHGVGRVS